MVALIINSERQYSYKHCIVIVQAQAPSVINSINAL